MPTDLPPPPSPPSHLHYESTSTLTHGRSATVTAIEANSELAASLIAKVSQKPHHTNPIIDTFALGLEKGTVFVGHLNTDMDSVGSSIGKRFRSGVV